MVVATIEGAFTAAAASISCCFYLSALGLVPACLLNPTAGRPPQSHKAKNNRVSLVTAPFAGQGAACVVWWRLARDAHGTRHRGGSQENTRWAAVVTTAVALHIVALRVELAHIAARLLLIA